MAYGKFFNYHNPRDCCEYKFYINGENIRYLSSEKIVQNLAARVYKFLTTTPPRLFLWSEYHEFYENQCIKGLNPNDFRNGLLCNCRYLNTIIEKKSPFVRILNDSICENLEEDSRLLRSYIETVRLSVINCLNLHKQSLIEEKIDILIISSSEKAALDEVSAREEKIFKQWEEERERERECRCIIL